MRNKFINIALKYQNIINTIFFIFLGVLLFNSIPLIKIYDIVLNIPNDIVNLFTSIINLITLFIVKFYNDLTSYPTNIKIISVGILKRFLFEDIIFPLLGKYYFKIIKEDLILYYKIKYREFKKFPLILRSALSSPIIASIISFLSYFKILSTISFLFKKIFTNTIFSKLKFIFIKWIPAAWIIVVDFPIISIIVDYLALSKIIQYIKDVKIIGINYIISTINNFITYIHKKIFFIRKHFYDNIGMYLKEKAILKKYNFRKKIDKILLDNAYDYHVLSKPYNNKSLKIKIVRINNLKKLRKDKQKQLKIKRKNNIKEKIKSLFKQALN